jgi:hypothetical protein
MTLSAASGAGKDRHTIEIPPDLYRQLERVLKNSRFNTVDDFALYVLRDLASHPSPLGDKSRSTPEAGEQREEPLTSEEIEIIQERLQNLGYL